METLHDDRLADIGLSDDQRVDVEVMVIFCVGDRGLERLLDCLGATLARELELGESAVHLLAADERSKQVELLGADADRARDSLRLVILQPAFGFSLTHRYFLFAFLSAP